LRRTRVKHAAAMRGVHARIASDLHDSVGASLSRIAILSDLALRESDASATATTGALTKIGDNARAVIDEMSDAVWFVDPKMEDVQQMVVRLRIVAAALFESNGTAWDIDAAPELLPLTLTADQRRHLFLILKEALTNVHRHAHATTVRVVIMATDSGLRAVVDDNGTGMLAECTGPGHGNGVTNMQKRARELAGTLSIQSRPAVAGTRIVIDVPLRH
jgi:signal transduction histidine kinase